MTTAGGRLVSLTGPGIAGELWRRAARTGRVASAGGLLVFRSTLGSNTAGVHHMYDPPAGGPHPGAQANAGFIVNQGRLMSR